MEWVTVRGPDVQTAVDRALDVLGVDLDEADVEVLDPGGRRWWSWRRREAVVRVRVRPRRPRPKIDRRRRERRRDRRRETGRTSAGRSGGSGTAAPDASRTGTSPPGRTGPSPADRRDTEPRGTDPTAPDRTAPGNTAPGDAAPGNTGRERNGRAGTGGGGSAPRRSDRSGTASGGTRPGHADPGDSGPPAAGEGYAERPTGSTPHVSEVAVQLSEQAETVREFLEGLLAELDLTGTVTVEVRPDDEVVAAAVDGGEELRLLIGGPQAPVLEAVQELTRSVVLHRAAGEAGRVIVDIGGFRQRRRAALERFARSVAEQVLADGRPKMLEPMNAADRKVVHDTVNAIPGVRTESAGAEPNRRVVIRPDT